MHARKQLDKNFKTFLQTIENTKKKYSEKNYNTNKEIKLIAVSKTQPIDAILELYKSGQNDFAENYLQEAISKINSIKKINDEDKNNLITITWHYIGTIQSNKTKLIAENFDWVHSVDNLKIATRLSNQRPSHLERLNLLIQINIDNDPNKSGIDTCMVLDLANNIKKLPNINLRGFMCILQKNSTTQDDFNSEYDSFNKVRLILEDLNKNHGFELDTLSMGMTNDYPAAIAAGSNMLRIGTALFGKRRPT